MNTQEIADHFQTMGSSRMNFGGIELVDRELEWPGLKDDFLEVHDEGDAIYKEDPIAQIRSCQPPAN